jgi:hypothetical protein
MRGLTVAIFTMLALAAPSAVRAMPNFADSIELLVAQSDIVVAGRIAATSSFDDNDVLGPWRTAVMSVDETIKGAPRTTLTFRCRDDDRNFRQLPPQGMPLLAFFVSTKDMKNATNNDGYRRYPFALLPSGQGVFRVATTRGSPRTPRTCAR